MDYAKNVKSLKGINLTDLFSFVWVDYEKNKETFEKNDLDHEGDAECSGQYFSKYDIEAYGLDADYDDYLSFDYNEYSEFINSLIKNGSGGYLIFSPDYGWRSNEVYKICTTKDEIFDRSYECEICTENASKGGKVLQFIEYSHDNPTGCTFYAIALNKSERKGLEYSGFEKIKNFVKRYAATIED